MYTQINKAMPIKLTKKTKWKSSSLKGRNKTETTERWGSAGVKDENSKKPEKILQLK